MIRKDNMIQRERHQGGLRRLVLGASLIMGLGGAFYVSTTEVIPRLIVPDFENAEWVSVPSSKQGIWKSYKGEDIKYSTANWHRYQWEVAMRNRVEDMNKYNKDRVELPDLDGDKKVVSGNIPYFIK